MHFHKIENFNSHFKKFLQTEKIHICVFGMFLYVVPFSSSLYIQAVKSFAKIKKFLK